MVASELIASADWLLLDHSRHPPHPPTPRRKLWKDFQPPCPRSESVLLGF